MKDELSFRHRVNPILQLGPASLDETCRALGLGLGQGDLSGVTLNLTAFDRASGHITALGADRDRASHDPFVQAGREIVDLDPSVRSEIQAAALL